MGLSPSLSSNITFDKYMSVQQTSLKFSLAAKKISQLKDQHYGRFVCIRAATKLLISQGFSREHSAKVAEAAFELIFTE